MEKKELRNMLRRSARKGTPEEATLLCNRLESLPHFSDANVLMLYSALPDEVPLTAVMDRLLEAGKTVVLPKVISDTEMELRQYTGRADLESGAFGILEPIGQRFTRYEDIEVVVVPGMAFDLQGHRLGRGRGYYDRFLPLLKNAWRIGICYPCRLLDQVPVGDHDMVMDEVLTVGGCRQ